jgi:hypothetical protein
MTSHGDSCPHCGGTGMVTIFDRRYRGAAVETRRYTNHHGEPRNEPVVMLTVTYCLCPRGAQMRAGIAPADSARLPDLAAVLEDRTRWTVTDPTRPEDR